MRPLCGPFSTGLYGIQRARRADGLFLQRARPTRGHYIAPLRFGTSTSDYTGGELEMNVHYYDLEAVRLKEVHTPPPDRYDGIPAYLFPLIGLILIFIAFAWRRMQERRRQIP